MRDASTIQPIQPIQPIHAWFAGPEVESGEWFADTINRIVQDS